MLTQTAVRGVSVWSRHQADRGFDFNSWLVENDDGTAFVVDPLEPDDALLARCRERGVRDVVITNRDHQRATARFVAELGCRVLAPAADAADIDVTVDRALHDGDDVFGWRVIVLDGFKTAGECVLFDPQRRAAISGDAFWGVPAGALNLMPDEKLADPLRAGRSARRIRALALDALLVGDGAPVYRDASAVLGAALDARVDAQLPRINLDEMDWSTADEPAPFGGASFDVDGFFGLSGLGARCVRLRPGEHFCSYHWHTREHELFVVLSGAPAMRGPHGTVTLRAGDLYGCPTGTRGAHRLFNDGPGDAVVLIVANADAGDACFYPDSVKLTVEAVGDIWRAAPVLDYYDGELPV